VKIFGPVFPVKPFKDIDTVIDFINSRPKPLALYVYSNDDAFVEKILTQTSSGGACINECISHVAVEALPFGGIENSGQGNVNGEYSFYTFTHKKSVLFKPTWLDADIRYPLYKNKNLGILKYATIELPSLNSVLLVLCTGMLALIAYLMNKKQ